MMLEARNNIEHEMWWEPRSGTANIWFDNWKKLGALYYLVPDDFFVDETVQDVKELRNQDGWNMSKLQQLFPTDIVDHILEELDFHESTEEWDKPRWMMTTSGKFTVGSAWELLRRKAGKSDIYKSMWILGKIASQVWRYVKAVVGITTTLLQVKQVIQVWWNADFSTKFKSIIRAIPMITMWQIWKWRNIVVHGGKMTINKVIYEINLTIHQMCRVRHPRIQVPKSLPQIMQLFETYRSHIVSKLVRWNLPMLGWFKCNSYGAARGNPGPSIVAFCIRNSEGDLVHAVARRISDGSNLVAEAMALQEGFKYCVTNDLLPVILETDSMTLKMILTGHWEIPWSISLIIKDITRLRRDKEVRVEHVLREGNGLADFLTNFVFDFAGEHQFNSYQSLPRKEKQILITENAQMPYIRIRQAKDHQIPGD
ncbi:uncharacterized protein LOC132637641 [Lycium barbarum]|uniref:uncharacterized protein LOC132637641 n=1 Tax=Lycium barbarum TaxID=112863 RepID=UPI00293ECFD8|nr:uncharacterized protein LOC132637641 [Lycium barbarum]